MATPGNKLTTAVEAYFTSLRQVRAFGGGTEELSYYPALNALFGAVGGSLKPKVYPVSNLANRGAGHPDFGLYSAKQVQKGRPREGQRPECGVVEVKSAGDSAWLTAKGDQVTRYWNRYGLVLVTNTRDFVLVGVDSAGNPAKLETFRLAESEEEFWQKIDSPRVFARESAASFGEYLARALSHRAALAEPKDLAWLLASYARDGLARVEAAGESPALATVRAALEEALGVRFEETEGTHFFHSTLVQTLFYGIFSAWVLWARHSPPTAVRFDWRAAVWHLQVPVLEGLFSHLSKPGSLQPLGLVEVLDWTAAALDRVDRSAFFSRFNEGEAVPYFYEPFLEAFDPDSRKKFGVWYTPAEVVRYMVARVDGALKDDLGIADGLAAENVYVLDPCCGTGAYIAEVLRRIAANLDEQGHGALTGIRIKQAATKRVFGFEIMPAPFVVAHLQVGLTMQDLDAPLAEDGSERAGVYLTNALTGWAPRKTKPLPFPELEEERDRTERVKQDTPILVVLGNPPYDGFAGMAMEEERELSDAYRSTRRVRSPEGHGLNEPYVRFFRMAERRIAEKSGQGVVCFISNYRWLDGPSFTGMRERFLEAFDSVRIDNLHGDRIISEYAPDGRSSETVFSIRGQSPGIRVGTSIALLTKQTNSVAGGNVFYRDFHEARAEDRRKAMLDSLETSHIDSDYVKLQPSLELGLPFKPMAVSEDWFNWPALPDLFQESFPGVKTSRDGFLVDTDLGRLRARIEDYFDTRLSHDDIARRYPGAIMKSTKRFDACSVRNTLLKRGGPNDSGFIRFAYRPFDTRWLYWEKDTKLLDEKRTDYRPHVFEGNIWLSAAQHLRKGANEPQACITGHMGCLHMIERTALMFPAWLSEDGKSKTNVRQAKYKGEKSVQNYLDRLGLGVEELFYHVLAVLHDPDYREANAGALHMEWPRIPLPGWPDGEVDGAAEKLSRSAAHGRELAALLDSDVPVTGTTRPPLYPQIGAIAVPAKIGGGNMQEADLAVTAGWGHFGAGGAVMAGKGSVVERGFSAEERTAMGDALSVLGGKTFDVYLNGEAFWRNIPEAVWNYRLGGYQVLKKWLSYRESAVLGRGLLLEEVEHFRDTARRIASILLLTSSGAWDSD